MSLAAWQLVAGMGQMDVWAAQCHRSAPCPMPADYRSPGDGGMLADGWIAKAGVDWSGAEVG